MFEEKSAYDLYCENRELVRKDAETIILEMKSRPGEILCGKCKSCRYSCPMRQELEKLVKDMPDPATDLDYCGAL